jgi:Sec-independent protein translocase protein TatA
MPFNLSVGEIVVLLVVAVILFGGRLPQVARTVAMTIGNIRRGMSVEMGKLDRDMRAATEAVKPASLIEPAGPVPGQECEDEGADEEEGDEAEPEETTPPERPPGPTPS